MSINDQLLNKQLSAYIICAFALASYIKLNPIESFLLYALSIIVFIFGLFHIDAPDIPFSIINSSILVLLAYSVSIINYYADFKDFINEKTIREKNIELEKHDRMKNIFFGNITHELRTPINLIYSAEQMLYKCVNNDSKNIQKKNILNKYLKMIKQNSFRLMRLINNIIDSSRMDFGEYKLNIKNYDIVDITRKIAASVSAYVELNNIHFSYNTNLNKIFIACDPDAIERILLNLISNAVKNTEENASINVSLYLEKEYVVISVKDTGIGIPKEEQKVIFNRFVQADNSISQKTVGSGIGLSLVNYLVKMHDGEIDLKSTPGKGSEFIIKIPNDIIEDEKVSEDKDSGREEINEKIRLEFSDIYLD
ncbi:sensor histidine kinase [Natronospora cellulosivora (SeqCode)]